MCPVQGKRKLNYPLYGVPVRQHKCSCFDEIFALRLIRKKWKKNVTSKTFYFIVLETILTGGEGPSRAFLMSRVKRFRLFMMVGPVIFLRFFIKKTVYAHYTQTEFEIISSRFPCDFSKNWRGRRKIKLSRRDDSRGRIEKKN